MAVSRGRNCLPSRGSFITFASVLCLSDQISVAVRFYWASPKFNRFQRTGELDMGLAWSWSRARRSLLSTRAGACLRSAGTMPRGRSSSIWASSSNGWRPLKMSSGPSEATIKSTSTFMESKCPLGKSKLLFTCLPLILTQQFRRV